METQRIAVFDVCGTLTQTNNTFDFIAFVLRNGSPLRYALLVLIRVLIPLGGVPGLRRIVSPERLRASQIALLRGYSAVRLRELAARYADAVFAGGLLNGRIVEAMRQERERGRAILLVSAALDPPIAALAERLGVRDFVSSELEIVDGRYTGRLRTDLLGRKQAVLERIAAGADLGDSSVYSDNPEDAAFMASFARRYIVLNTCVAEKMWRFGGGGFEFIRNYEATGSERDVDSVNEGTAKWVYVPTLYYVVSRFHRTGLYSLLLREIVPVTLAVYLFTNLGALSFVLMPLSFAMFYSIYEIGGAVNDLWVNREPPGTGTRRIAPQVHLRMAPFVSIRIAVVAFLLAVLPVTVRPALLYAGLLCLCLAVYLLHSALAGRQRILTFLLLKGCRDCIPLALVAFRVPLTTLAWLGTIFFVMDAPWRVYAYCVGRRFIRERISRWRVRCTQVAILGGVGAVIYLFTGAPHLLAVALYYAVLECLWVVRAIRWPSRSLHHSRFPGCRPGKALAAGCSMPDGREEPSR